MWRRRHFLGLSLATLASAACGSKSGSKQIAVIPKGTTHEFWKSVHAGAVKASRELGVEIVWKGPLKEDDRTAQIEVVQSFISQGVAGIVLAPLDDKALQPPVKQAIDAKIPVVIFDSDLQGDAHSSFVATDNGEAGKLAAEAMAKLLGDKGKVAVLRYQVGSASTQKREDGFLDAIKAHTGIEVVSSDQYAGATTETASAKAEAMLNGPAANVDGIFCPNESSTFGMLLALEKAKLAGKVKFFGFDSSEKLVNGLKDEKIHGLVLQNPFNMGYLATKTIQSVIKGEKVDKRIDTGAQLITKANMEEPDKKAVLSPNLKEWLGE
ncbi:MAG: substrate-binding domain-containing protein [Polyangiaceae bacterium]